MTPVVSIRLPWKLCRHNLAQHVHVVPGSEPHVGDELCSAGEPQEVGSEGRGRGRGGRGEGATKGSDVTQGFFIGLKPVEDTTEDEVFDIAVDRVREVIVQLDDLGHAVTLRPAVVFPRQWIGGGCSCHGDDTAPAI